MLDASRPAVAVLIADHGRGGASDDKAIALAPMKVPIPSLVIVFILQLASEPGVPSLLGRRNGRFEATSSESCRSMAGAIHRICRRGAYQNLDERARSARAIAMEPQHFRKKRDKLFAGITMRSDSSRLCPPATAVTSSRCRMPQAESPRLRLRSKDWLLGAVSTPRSI